MKKLIALILFLAVFFTLLLTCPDKKMHQEALKNRVNDLVTNKVAELDSTINTEGMAFLSTMILSPIVDEITKHELEVDNYLLFSVGKLKIDSESHFVSFGILNQVLTPSNSQLEASAKEILEDKGL